MRQGDCISYNSKTYKVDWTLEDNNVIDIKNNETFYIEECKKVKWLRNYEYFTLIK